MSDLAPFVAAVVRDKVILELLEENQKLREENEWIKSGNEVRFTGPNSAPNYAIGDVKKAMQSVLDEGGDEMRRKRVAVSNLDEHPKSALDLCNTEVWVGNHRVGELVNAYNQAVDSIQNDDGENYLNFRFMFWEHQYTYVETSLQVGPFTDEEAETELRNCNLGAMSSLKPISGLQHVPAVTFKAIDLYEPNFVMMD